MYPALTVAITAARKAGEIMMRSREQLDKLTIQRKAPQDFCSEIDWEAEREIIKILSKSYPHHGIQAEESGLQQDKSDYLWVIDPLDGTTNYLHGHPFFCVSIALKIKQRLECAVIFDPVQQECFVASRGEGARLNDHRLRVSKVADLSDAIVGTTYSGTSKQKVPDKWRSGLRHVFETVVGYRKNGAAALELAYVAAGRLDGFLGVGLHPWDMAAGALIIKEAGGMVTDFSGTDDYLQNGHILAANPKIFRAVLQGLQVVG